MLNLQRRVEIWVTALVHDFVCIAQLRFYQTLLAKFPLTDLRLVRYCKNYRGDLPRSVAVAFRKSLLCPQRWSCFLGVLSAAFPGGDGGSPPDRAPHLDSPSWAAQHWLMLGRCQSEQGKPVWEYLCREGDVEWLPKARFFFTQPYVDWFNPPNESKEPAQLFCHRTWCQLLGDLGEA